ncbi:hypothetical protein ACFY5F_45970 [Streptomyces sp. NPDC013161]|uniref:hypothetical protein n=1 Tax=Streptomyces sp. NPDC013161 TaxID=3364862 RepID=UPI0036B57B4C
MAASDPQSLQRLLTLLDCLAADHQLGGMIVFDLDASLLFELGQLLAERMGQDRPDGRTPDVVVLGAGTTADDLWLRTVPDDAGFAMRPGVLVEDPYGPPPVVLVPDLGRLGLPVAQAAVTLLLADTASAQRFGHSLNWQPHARWLTAVPRYTVAQLSPHLLDRFPLRADASGIRQELDALHTGASPATDDSSLLRAAMPTGRPRRSPVALSPDAARLVVSSMPASPSRRRDLALARIARALSEDAPQILPDHVRRAAALLGLTTQPPPDLTPPPQPSTAGPPPEVPSEVISPASESADATPRPRRAVAAGAAQRLPATSPLPDRPTVTPSPYPEDEPSAFPPFASLRPARRPTAGASTTRHHAAGVRPARSLRSLAVVATVFEAAKFQHLRRTALRPGGHGLAIRAADLREYRPGGQSESALVLVLDHSSRATEAAAPALAPHLRWAYRQGAAVSIVEFGHQDTSDELAAEHYRAATLLDPRVVRSLTRRPGLASPLAHAIDLAVQELRRHRRNRAVLHETVLVVVTDGRGNVPLTASLLGRVPEGVGREGVTDALLAAAAVRRLPRVQTIVIAPETSIYPELAADLADATGGRLITVAGPGRRSEVRSR